LTKLDRGLGCLTKPTDSRWPDRPELLRMSALDLEPKRFPIRAGRQLIGDTEIAVIHPGNSRYSGANGTKLIAGDRH
jgi:hypothetical protein